MENSRISFIIIEGFFPLVLFWNKHVEMRETGMHPNKSNKWFMDLSLSFNYTLNSRLIISDRNSPLMVQMLQL